MNPSVAWTGDNYYVAWEDGRNALTSSTDIYLARMSAYGYIIDPGGIVVPQGTYPELRPTVVAAGADYGAVFYDKFINWINRLEGRICAETTTTPVATIRDLKSLPNGTRISISDKIATAGTDQLPGYFYIEETDRTSGIKVVSGDPAREGKLTSVKGTLQTVNGERQITATWIGIGLTGTVPDPFSMSITSLGGPALNEYTPGVKGGRGVNNIGLLVRIWGKVTSTGAGYFYVDDGSILIISEEHSEPLPAKVICGTGVTPPALNSYVTVTGISSCEPSGADSVRRILARKPGDIVPPPKN